MSAMNEKVKDKDIISYMYRTKYPNTILAFSEIVLDALRVFVMADEVELERLAVAKTKNLWALVKRDIVNDLNNSIVPLFDIIDEQKRLVKWIGVQCDKNKYLYVIRPELYGIIDKMTNREYEALACVICKLLGAQNVLLTPPGNEDGIDFIASIKFSNSAHHLFGTKGPLRIIGQCKKYSSKDNVGHMKEFIQTIDTVHNQSFRAGQVLPSWFKTSAGPIIGWHIAHSGHQSGASDRAKNFGILTSDTKEIVDLICKSRIPGNQKGTYKDKVIYILNECQNFIKLPEQ